MRAMYGTRVTWMKSTSSLLGTSFLNWRMASRKGCPSMSPTVPPISTRITSASLSSATRRMWDLISLVMCGITCTVPPR